MVFYYGTKNELLKNGQFTNIVCPNCDKQVIMNFSVYQKYAHLYLIPFFPIKKLTFVECNSCKETFEDKELIATTLYRLERAKGKIKTPLSAFVGPLMIVGITLIYFLNSFAVSSTNNNYIEKPEVGDVYYITSPNNFYTTIKATKILKDSLVLSINQMEVETKSEISKIDLEENYNRKEKIAKKDLANFLYENQLIEVVRPY